MVHLLCAAIVGISYMGQKFTICKAAQVCFYPGDSCWTPGLAWRQLKFMPEMEVLCTFKATKQCKSRTGRCLQHKRYKVIAYYTWIAHLKFAGLGIKYCLPCSLESSLTGLLVKCWGWYHNYAWHIWSSLASVWWCIVYCKAGCSCVSFNGRVCWCVITVYRPEVVDLNPCQPNLCV